MSDDHKGHIWYEEDEKPGIFVCKQDPSTLPSPTQCKNFCPNCGSGDLDLRRETVFGTPAYIVRARCRNCGHVF